ncbi:uncharacterized protein EV422DRAFT_541536 [Fimicolochytrium jonesii]|uniref:uncharacterized protein n=1 Tax=Fimicolochytrium jonesii TaxID=1396493 RepID=UPI0022FF033E|nr:uncharacterized protein EV422DRAFT_541536 [Fimicolochytrium jonesii]KAI8817361.1 hypothetical protein EV422DRAFT_541536 [Fimicolochytrium jonesii]
MRSLLLVERLVSISYAMANDHHVAARQMAMAKPYFSNAFPDESLCISKNPYRSLAPKIGYAYTCMFHHLVLFEHPLEIDSKAEVPTLADHNRGTATCFNATANVTNVVWPDLPQSISDLTRCSAASCIGGSQKERNRGLETGDVYL